MTSDPTKDLGEVEALAAKMPESITGTELSPSHPGWKEEVIQPEVRQWILKTDKIRACTFYDDDRPHPYSVKVVAVDNPDATELQVYHLESIEEAKVVVSLILKMRGLG